MGSNELDWIHQSVKYAPHAFSPPGALPLLAVFGLSSGVDLSWGRAWGCLGGWLCMIGNDGLCYDGIRDGWMDGWNA